MTVDSINIGEKIKTAYPLSSVRLLTPRVCISSITDHFLDKLICVVCWEGMRVCVCMCLCLVCLHLHIASTNISACLS